MDAMTGGKAPLRSGSPAGSSPGSPRSVHSEATLATPAAGERRRTRGAATRLLEAFKQHLLEKHPDPEMAWNTFHAVNATTVTLQEWNVNGRHLRFPGDLTAVFRRLVGDDRLLDKSVFMKLFPHAALGRFGKERSMNHVKEKAHAAKIWRKTEAELGLEDFATHLREKFPDARRTWRIFNTSHDNKVSRLEWKVSGRQLRFPGDLNAIFTQLDQGDGMLDFADFQRLYRKRTGEEAPVAAAAAEDHGPPHPRAAEMDFAEPAGPASFDDVGGAAVRLAPGGGLLPGTRSGHFEKLYSDHRKTQDVWTRIRAEIALMEDEAHEKMSGTKTYGTMPWDDVERMCTRLHGDMQRKQDSLAQQREEENARIDGLATETLKASLTKMATNNFHGKDRNLRLYNMHGERLARIAASQKEVVKRQLEYMVEHDIHEMSAVDISDREEHVQKLCERLYNEHSKKETRLTERRHRKAEEQVADLENWSVHKSRQVADPAAWKECSIRLHEGGRRLAAAAVAVASTATPQRLRGHAGQRRASEGAAAGRGGRPRRVDLLYADAFRRLEDKRIDAEMREYQTHRQLQAESVHRDAKQRVLTAADVSQVYDRLYTAHAAAIAPTPLSKTATSGLAPSALHRSTSRPGSAPGALLSAPGARGGGAPGAAAREGRSAPGAWSPRSARGDEAAGEGDPDIGWEERRRFLQRWVENKENELLEAPADFERPRRAASSPRPRSRAEGGRSISADGTPLDRSEALDSLAAASSSSPGGPGPGPGGERRFASPRGKTGEWTRRLHLDEMLAVGTNARPELLLRRAADLPEDEPVSPASPTSLASPRAASSGRGDRSARSAVTTRPCGVADAAPPRNPEPLHSLVAEVQRSAFVFEEQLATALHFEAARRRREVALMEAEEALMRAFVAAEARAQMKSAIGKTIRQASERLQADQKLATDLLDMVSRAKMLETEEMEKKRLKKLAAAQKKELKKTQAALRKRKLAELKMKAAMDKAAEAAATATAGSQGKKEKAAAAAAEAVKARLEPQLPKVPKLKAPKVHL